MTMRSKQHVQKRSPSGNGMINGASSGKPLQKMDITAPLKAAGAEWSQAR